MGYLLLKNSCGTIKPIFEGKFIFLPMGISLKVNSIAQLEFELTHYDVTAWNINH